MRSKSWRQDLDKQATLDAYRKAKQDGAVDLANRIRIANSEGDFDLTNEFNLIDQQLKGV
jgi:hypothetical protein